MKRFSASVHASLGEFIGRYSPRRADIIMQIGRAPRNRANTRSDESVTEVNARWIVWSRVGGGGFNICKTRAAIHYLATEVRSSISEERRHASGCGMDNGYDRLSVDPGLVGHEKGTWAERSVCVLINCWRIRAIKWLLSHAWNQLDALEATLLLRGCSGEGGKKKKSGLERMVK